MFDLLVSKKIRIDMEDKNDCFFLQSKQIMLINDTNMKSFLMAKIFHENTERINACNFNKNGLSNFAFYFFFLFF